MKVTKVLGLAAIGALLVLAAPSERASAMSLSSPGTAAAVQDSVLDSSKPTVIEAGWRRGWRRHHWHPHYGRRRY